MRGRTPTDIRSLTVELYGQLITCTGYRLSIN
jgi:hypothetical protein